MEIEALGKDRSLESFVSATIRLIATKLGLPPQTLDQSFDATKYSGARCALLEERKRFPLRHTFDDMGGM